MPEPLTDELRRLRKHEQEWINCVEALAGAAYRLQKLAEGADVPDGDVGFACKQGYFHEQIAHAAIAGLRAERDRLRTALEPFAALARRIDADESCKGMGDDCSLMVRPDSKYKDNPTLGDLRRAAEALGETR